MSDSQMNGRAVPLKRFGAAVGQLLRHHHLIGACVLLLRIVFAVLGTTAVWMFLSQFLWITPPLSELIILPTFLLLLLCNREEALDALRAYTGAAIGFAFSFLLHGMERPLVILFCVFAGLLVALVENHRRRRSRHRPGLKA